MPAPMPKHFNLFIRQWKIISVLFLFPLFVAAQRNGISVTKFPDGKISETGMMKKGKRDGQWKKFDDDGTLSSIYSYSEGKRNGTCYEFYNGDTMLIGNYKNDNRSGEWKAWNSRHQLISIEHFDGQQNKTGVCEYWDEAGNLSEYSIYNPDGTSVTYSYRNGKPESVTRKKNDLPDGKQVYYNHEQEKLSPADSIHEITNYTKGVQDGNDIFYENSKVISESHYCNGSLCDTTKTFDADGRVTKLIPYVKGKEDGTELQFSHGVMIVKTNYSDGKKNGKQTVKTESGKLQSESWYTGNTLDSSFVWYTDGGSGIKEKTRHEANPNSFSEKYVTQVFSPDGKLKIQFQSIHDFWENVILDGEYITYFSNGKPQASLNYSNNAINGNYQKWNQNGILVLESMCSNNVLTDSLKVWDDSGQPIQEGTIEFDEAVVKNMEVGMEFRSRTSGNNSAFQYFKNDSTDNFEDCKVYTFAEIMPEFPGGSQAFMTYIGKNIEYPQIEKESGKTGTVYVSFIVTRNGKVVDVHCVKEVRGAPDFSKEAMRVFKSMPDWKPGMQNGKAVNVMVTQPVKFILQ